MAAWPTGLAAAPRVPLWTPGRRTLSASDRPPRSARSPCLPLPGNKCAGASAREPGNGAGAWPAPRSAPSRHHGRPKIFVLIAHGFGFFNGFPLHGRLKRSVTVEAIPAYGTSMLTSIITRG